MTSSATFCLSELCCLACGPLHSRSLSWPHTLCPAPCAHLTPTPTTSLLPHNEYSHLFISVTSTHLMTIFKVVCTILQNKEILIPEVSVYVNKSMLMSFLPSPTFLWYKTSIFMSPHFSFCHDHDLSLCQGQTRRQP